ncbi:MAG TPA: hypothetical protein VKM54_05290 [Myxococcota bacterium]|nr:hypothetical protein [Myxococcota bacterium]
MIFVPAGVALAVEIVYWERLACDVALEASIWTDARLSGEALGRLLARRLP